MKDLVLIGGGGHCKACIDVIEQTNQFRIVGILDELKRSDGVFGYEVLGSDKMIEIFIKKNYEFLITIGQLRTHQNRRKLFYRLQGCKARIATVISPRAYVSKHAVVEQGTIVMHDALINAGAKVGKNCIINSKSLIEHDAVVEEHCHISTGAVLNGGVVIREGTFFGSNAVSVQNSSTLAEGFVKAGSLFKGNHE